MPRLSLVEYARSIDADDQRAVVAREVLGLVSWLFELEFLIDIHGVPDQSAVDLSTPQPVMSQEWQIEQQAAKASGGWPPGGTEQRSQAGGRGAREGGQGKQRLV